MASDPLRARAPGPGAGRRGQSEAWSHPVVPTELLARLRPHCLGLDDAQEEAAWAGVRWRVRSGTFAHAVQVVDGWPPAYAEAAATRGPASVLITRADPGTVWALRQVGPPFFTPDWFTDVVGVRLDEDTDWHEVADLIALSHRRVAPPLVERADRMRT